LPSAIDSKAMSLSVRLLRQNRSVETALRKDQELTEVDAENGRLFIGRAPVPQSWLPFVGPFATGPASRLRSRSCGAIIFLNVQTETKPSITGTMLAAFQGPEVGL
jgi:hypothetical protein